MTAGRGRILIAVAATVVANLLAIALTMFGFRAVGEIAFGQPVAHAFPVIAGSFGAAYLLEAMAAATGGIAGALTTLRLRRYVLAVTLRTDPDRTRHLGVGDALAIGMDLDLVGVFLSTTAPAAVLAIIEIAGGAIALSVGPEPQLCLGIGGCAVVILLLLAMLLGRLRVRWSSERRSITARLVERLLGQRTVTMQDDAATSAAEKTRRARGYRLVSIRLDRTQVALTSVPLIALFALVGVLLIGAHPDAAALATGLFGALLTVSGLNRLATVMSDLGVAWDAFASLRNLRTLSRSEPPQPAAPTSATKALDELSPDDVLPSGTIISASGVRAVYGDYGGGLPFAFSLDVADGEQILLTGPSGSGKTTLGEVLSSRRSATSGTVVRRVGSTVARVPQAGDDHIFQASLLFNLVGGQAWPPQPEDVLRAEGLLHDLELADLVQRMPAGLAQPVGDGGWRLSSGERARISLIRALMTQPDLLIMDETTAALDPLTRKVLLDVAQDHSNAIVLIAHP